MPSRTSSISRDRSEGYSKTQKKIEYLEYQVGKINEVLNILFQKFGTWPDEKTFIKYGFPYLIPDDNYVKLEDVKKLTKTMFNENKLKERARNAYFDGKKSRRKQRKFMPMKGLAGLFTRRTKPVSKPVSRPRKRTVLRNKSTSIKKPVTLVINPNQII
tara:strand:- start:141 stop:617 length:477 start_codon:yes stop_codon:yes gene_type:complete